MKHLLTLDTSNRMQRVDSFKNQIYLPLIQRGDTSRYKNTLNVSFIYGDYLTPKRCFDPLFLKDRMKKNEFESIVSKVQFLLEELRPRENRYIFRIFNLVNLVSIPMVCGFVLALASIKVESDFRNIFFLGGLLVIMIPIIVLIACATFAISHSPSLGNITRKDPTELFEFIESLSSRFFSSGLEFKFFLSSLQLKIYVIGNLKTMDRNQEADSPIISMGNEF